ncbi:hypothetical protein GJ744_007044 [Endocarpon pusillum]|uniref:Uncharacterized protein n=1 Tax=Endocarpon pusillum TaxID=364733 RepID=A0A8H7E6E4_9EURO|nr:hypothetical protein GJ744_007044 [Endocarpon pusillum]
MGQGGMASGMSSRLNVFWWWRRLKTDTEEVMEKEEGEKGARQEKELPFIPFPSGSGCQLSHDELAISPSRPGPIASVTHPSATPLQQANMIQQCCSLSKRLVLVCGSPVAALPGTR